MIRKQDILDRVDEWGLPPQVVEKDYVLGWLLAAFAAHAATTDAWIFKGGTCLKKCYFETYRFSEDLDFTLLPGSPYDQGALRAVVVEVVQRAAEQSGLEFPSDRIEIRARQDKLGRPTFQGRISYRGPLAAPNWPRVLLDLTRNEPLLLSFERRAISHPYPDQASLADVAVACYSLPELLAEKTRALFERTRPRDLYDVAQLGERQGDVRLDACRKLFRDKCAAKGFAPPTAAALMSVVRAAPELRSEWANMLAHQLPALPDVDHVLGRVQSLIAWIDEPAMPLPVAVAPPAVPLRPQETVLSPRGGYYWGSRQRLERVRFAGANLLMITFEYNGRVRHAEPYSLRRKGTGNLLLYAWEQGETHIKAFDTIKMRNVDVLSVPFVPRYRVEFTG